MIDISSPLHRAAHHGRARLSDASVTLTARVADAVTGSVDWDDGAGEDWAIVRRRDHIVAFVYMLSPIVITEAAYEPTIRREVGPEVDVIGVNALDKPELCAAADALAAAFGPRVAEGELEADAFTANDLWFWTI